METRTPRPRIFTIDGLNLCVWDWFGESEHPILFAHGNSFHGRCWDAVIELLPQQRCLAIDLRGHGRSDSISPPARWQDFGQDLIDISRDLNLNRVIGVGHSLGGHAITYAAATAPDLFASLVLVDPVILPRESYALPSPENQATLRRRNYFASSDEMFERFKTRPPFSSWQPRVLRDYCQFALRPKSASNSFELACSPEVESAIYLTANAPDANLYDLLPSIAIPVLLIRSAQTKDGASSARTESPTAPNLISFFERGTELIAKDNSHFIPMESPERMANWIRLALLKTINSTESARESNSRSKDSKPRKRG
jgi:pimeloyl-ACP methyl ester carboxylesterase